MDFIGQLWQPILLSTALVFIVSALVWTVLPHHQKEWKGLPGEQGVRDAIKAAGFGAGIYMFPWADEKARRTPEHMAKVAEGPSGMVTLFAPGPMDMKAMMAKSIVGNLIVSFFTAYVAHHAFVSWPAPPSYLKVFQVVGTVGFMTYGLGAWGDMVWFGKPLKSWLLQAGDALLYGLVMGGTFGWLWPR